MTYKLRFKEVDIPEIDHFLAGYRALCEVHGMQLATVYLNGWIEETLETFDPDRDDTLDLDHADDNIPCIALAIEAIESERRQDLLKADVARQEWLKDPANKPVLLREGIWLEGQHYKLVSD